MGELEAPHHFPRTDGHVRRSFSEGGFHPVRSVVSPEPHPQRCSMPLCPLPHKPPDKYLAASSRMTYFHGKKKAASSRIRAGKAKDGGLEYLRKQAAKYNFQALEYEEYEYRQERVLAFRISVDLDSVRYGWRPRIWLRFSTWIPGRNPHHVRTASGVHLVHSGVVQG